MDPASSTPKVNEATVNVVLVESQAMLRDGIAAYLLADDRLRLVKALASLAEFNQSLNQWDKAVVVVDHVVEDGRGTDIPHMLEIADKEAPVLIIATDSPPGVAGLAIAAGCAGFVAKSSGLEELADSIIGLSRGASVFPASALLRAQGSDPSQPGSNLTRREREVLGRLASAKIVAEIAAELHLSQNTVRNHIRSILSKLGARSQLDAVVRAHSLGLIEIRAE